MLNINIMRSLLMEVKHNFMIKQITGKYQNSTKVNHNRKIKDRYKENDEEYLEKLFYINFIRL